MNKHERSYTIVDADRRHPVRNRWTHQPRLALALLYRIAKANPDNDFLVVDNKWDPVPASRLQAEAEIIKEKEHADALNRVGLK